MSRTARRASCDRRLLRGIAGLGLDQTTNVGFPASYTNCGQAILQQPADDLGKPGNGDFYGTGRVNALQAVRY